MCSLAEGVSTETIVAIAFAAIIQNSHQTKLHWKHSMQGLKALLNYDGVLATLEHNPLVLGALCRADLSGSLDVLQTPLLSQHIAWPQIPSDVPLRNGFVELEQVLSLNQRVRYSLQRLSETVDSKRRVLDKDLLSAAKCRFVVTGCQYNLLSYECTGISNELCRLSLIICTLTIVDECPHDDSAYGGLLTKFQTLLEPT